MLGLCHLILIREPAPCPIFNSRLGRLAVVAQRVGVARRCSAWCSHRCFDDLFGRWYVLRKVVCRSCAAPAMVVEMVLDDLGVRGWDQRRVADVLLDGHDPAVDHVVGGLDIPRRGARPRT